MDIKLKELYDKIDSIFQKYTTYRWKNGWQNEGDRTSKELTVQNPIPNHNEFLLLKFENEISLKSNNGLKLVLKTSDKNSYRVDITFKNKHIYYYIDDENWYLNSEYVLNLCKCIYETTVRQRETINFPSIYGDLNPSFLKEYLSDLRDNKIDKILECQN
jgi:hypothetical protein